MAKASDLVSWAQSQIGVKESPAGSNKVKYWDAYKKRCGVNYQGSPWCAAFVTDGMCTIGQWKQTSDEGRFRYCPSLVNWAKQNGQWLDRSAVCQPGDIILFANKGTACHVGIVEKRISSSEVQTIEGNTSVTSNDNGGAVMRRNRSYGTVGSSWYILGFVRSPWNGTATTTPSTPAPAPTPNTSTSTTTGSASIKAVQEWCNINYGFNQKVDGVNGPNTRKGLIRALQTELNKQYGKGLVVDGVWGSKTQNACVVIKKGAKGNLTKTLQGALIVRGYNTGGFDGDFGSKTYDAVKSFQANKGLTKDGEVGKNTWKALMNA